MTVSVRTITAESQRELDRLVQLAIAQGWQPVGNPGEVNHNGVMRKAKWQQPMRRK